MTLNSLCLHKLLLNHHSVTSCLNYYPISLPFYSNLWVFPSAHLLLSFNKYPHPTDPSGVNFSILSIPSSNYHLHLSSKRKPIPTILPLKETERRQPCHRFTVLYPPCLHTSPRTVHHYNLALLLTPANSLVPFFLSCSLSKTLSLIKSLPTPCLQAWLWQADRST